MQVPSISPISPMSDWTMLETPMGDMAFADAAQFPSFKMAPVGYGPVDCSPGYFGLHVPPNQAGFAAFDFNNYSGPALPVSQPPAMSPGTIPSPRTVSRMSSIPTPPLVDRASTPTPFKKEAKEISSHDVKPKPHGMKRKQPSPPPPEEVIKPKPQSHLRTAKRSSQSGAAGRNKAARQSPDHQHPSSSLPPGAPGSTEIDSEVKARAAHNQVEQQYRQRLNAHFERLLAVLPVGDRDSDDGETCGGGIEPDRRKVSKAEVLDLARRRIEVLEWEVRRLEKEKREMLLGGSS
ncbi:Allergen Fus [Paramyrothecium foliicola]|nr:Allergen Fus [Paramyrothecium foliicola]